MATARTESWQGEGGVWVGTFTADTNDMNDKTTKGKGRGRGKSAGNAGNARDRSVSGKRGGKPRGKAKAKGKPAGGQATPDKAAAPPPRRLPTLRPTMLRLLPLRPQLPWTRWRRCGTTPAISHWQEAAPTISSELFA